MLSVTPIPVLKDNYAYFLEDTTSGITAIVDPSRFLEVDAFLESVGKGLHFILNTHHHWDHVGGNAELVAKYGARVAGFAGDEGQLPGQSIFLKDGEIFALGHACARILHIPGHTLTHGAYFFEESGCVFTGDTLFHLGCGRLFEGTPSQMWASLSRLMALPDDTRIFCGHEYLLSNLAFARHLYPDDEDLLALEGSFVEARRKGEALVGFPLSFEKRFNPFLRCLHDAPQDALELFTARRLEKDGF